jgi:hypothetical protein
MSRGRSRGLVSLLTFGVAAFLVACLSILDMFLPRPYDGVILDPDRSEIVVRALARAGRGRRACSPGPHRGRRARGRPIRIRGGPGPPESQDRERVPYLLERGGLHEVVVECWDPGSWYDLVPLRVLLRFPLLLHRPVRLLQRLEESAGEPVASSPLCTLFMLFWFAACVQRRTLGGRGRAFTARCRCSSCRRRSCTSSWSSEEA